MKLRSTQFKALIIFIFCTIAVIVVLGLIALIRQYSQNKYKNFLSNQQITKEWRNYEGDTFSISYPHDWKIEKPHFDSFYDPAIIFKSPNFAYRSELSNTPQKGVLISFYIGRQQYPIDSQLGLVSSKDTTWLGEEAFLNTYNYEGDALVLTTKHNGIDYQLVMSDEITSNYENYFLQIASTIKIKDTLK